MTLRDNSTIIYSYKLRCHVKLQALHFGLLGTSNSNSSMGKQNCRKIIEKKSDYFHRKLLREANIFLAASAFL